MPNKWETFFDECIREIAKENIILDIGSGSPFQKEMGKYKGLFEGCKYYSLDCTIQYHPDVVGDAHNLPFKEGSMDALICKAVLEHVPEPQKVVKEMYRVLRKSGKAFVYVPFLFYYHGYAFGDYYRFTKDAIGYMFRDFKEVEFIPVRGVVGIINLLIPFTPKNSRLANFFDKLLGKTKYSFFKNNTSGYNIFAVK